MTTFYTSRKNYFDIMRILAIFLVVFNHLPGYALYQISNEYMVWPYMFITMFTRINVPLFFMISGALLLSREENYKTLFLKRILRFIIVIFVFELILYCEYGNNGYNMSILDFFRGMLSGTIYGAYSYWYLYAYLGMLLMLPFLRKICSQIKKQDFLLLIGVHFLFSSLVPILKVVLPVLGVENFGISGDFDIPLATLKVSAK